MITKRILTHSVATLLALAPFPLRAAQQSITAGGTPTSGASGANPAWGTDANWSGPNGALKPTASDNAAITFAGTVAAGVDIRGSGLGGATTIQDLSFIGTGSGPVTLENNSTSTDMVLTLNGGRGAGFPLIQSGVYAVTIAAIGPGTTHPLTLTLAASGEINAGTGGLTIAAVINETGGAQSIAKTGANRLILSGVNAFTGGTTLTAGILEVGNNASLGTGAAVLNGGTLELNVASATLTASSLTLNAGSQIATRGSVTLNNAMTLNGGTLATRNNDSGVYAGAINVTANSFANLRSYSSPTSDLSITVSGLVSGNAGLTINGNATNATSGKALILTNTANSYSGTFTINTGQTLRNAPASTGRTIGSGAIQLSGGTLQLRDDGAGSDGTLSYGNNVVVQSAASRLDVDHVTSNTGNTFQLGTLSIGAQTLSATGASGYGVRFGATTLTGAATLDPTTATMTLGGGVSGGFGITKTGAGTLIISGTQSYSALTTSLGTTTLNSSLPSATIVNNGGILNLNAGATNSSVAANATTNFGAKQKLTTLGIGGTGTAKLTAHTGGPANIKSIDTAALSISAGGKLDLTNNALVVRGGSLATITAAITSGLYSGVGGYWDGPGINSSSAAADSNFLTALGVLDNSLAQYPDFAGVTGLTGAEILVKYTYYGDSDLSGTVTADDFSLFLTGFNDPLSKGWVFGDYDYSGTVTADDFSLFLNAFNNQGGPLRDPALAAELARFAGQIGAGSADPASDQAVVPEPGSITLLAAGALGLLSRRRRKA